MLSILLLLEGLQVNHMIGFKQFLDEIFSNPLKWVKKHNHNRTEYDFSVGNNKYVSEFRKIPPSLPTGKAYHQVDFYIDRNGYLDSAPTDIRKDSIPVLSTVVDTIKDYNKHVQSGDYISFSANDRDSRTRLYQRMAMDVGKKLDYDMEQYLTPVGMKFVLRKK